MDRIGAVLAGILVVTATVTLLGAQGARAASFPMPSLSPWWVLASAVLVLLLTPSEVPEASPGTRSKRTVIAGALFVFSFLLLLFWRQEALYPRASLDYIVGHAGAPRRGISLQIERRNELRRLTGLRRNVEIETEGWLEVPESGTYRFNLSCDDFCELELDKRVLRARGEHSETVRLDAGEVPFSLRYHQGTGPARLAVEWETPAIFEPLPIDYFVRSPEGAKRNRWSANLSLAAFVLWWGSFSLFLMNLARKRDRWIARRSVPVTLAMVLMAYGSLLRLEALLTHSGLARESPRAAEIHDTLASYLPSYGLFNPDSASEDPYRADVRSYLDRAESMSLGTFYAPSFREPFYPLLVSLFVSLAGGEIGILVLSFVFSMLTLPLFYAVARRFHGDWWATALLVPISLHEWLVLEAPTGYRMSVYAFFLVAFVAYVMLADATQVPRRAAGIAGITGGLVCLIRLSALSVVAPVLALRAPGLARRELFAYVSVFVMALALLVAPFLWSNFRAHGDPFYSVSFHTEFWLRAEGIRAPEGPVSLSRYFTGFGRTGDVVKGTLLGMTVLPLRTFWNGLRHFPLLGLATLVLGVPGLVLASRGPARFLTAAYLGHLLPFAYIQNFPSGEMPRFVMPAFFFLVLAIPVTVKVACRIWAKVKSTDVGKETSTSSEARS